MANSWNGTDEINVISDCHNFNVNHYNYDSSSTIVSESIIGSSDCGSYENHAVFYVKPMLLDNSGSPLNISVEHSNDVLFGNKTVITGPVVIKNFIAESEMLNNGYQKDVGTDATGASEIIEVENTAIDQRLKNFRKIFRRRRVIIVTFVLLISTALVAALCGYYLVKSPQKVVPYTSDDFEFISREDYNASPRRGQLKPLNLPVKYVIVAHTLGANCTNLERCKEVARYVQWYHQEIYGWDEIGLNFMVGGDGRVYEGSGYEEGAHTLGYNFDSVCISLIGDFSEYPATKEQLETVKKVIGKGVTENKIQRQYVLYAHKFFVGGDSPGKFVYDEIVKWQQFSPVVLPKS